MEKTFKTNFQYYDSDKDKQTKTDYSFKTNLVHSITVLYIGIDVPSTVLYIGRYPSTVLYISRYPSTVLYIGRCPSTVLYIGRYPFYCLIYW